MKYPLEQFKRNQRGVALVITLIMLSVITFLTVAFLAISRRDRASVTTSLSQTDAHMMADTALARMQSEMAARMIAQNTLQAYDVMLTRNYFNTNGFDSALGRNTTNVNYFDLTTGALLPPADMMVNLANLFYDPRPPVFVQTNRDKTLPLDFRFYLDYNRNGRFETNSENGVDFIKINYDDLGKSNGINRYIGEPEWIGVLQNPEYPHSGTNRFVGRYLYFALPISRTLDLNYIHNYAKGNIGMNANVSRANLDGFLRNQGYGSYELNLAAFLNDLNTNMYPNVGLGTYQYYPTPTPNTGDAFDDAVSILGYRYDFNQNNLLSVNTLFGNLGRTAFQNDLIDGYSTRPILVPPFHNITDPDKTPSDLTAYPWPGSKNPKEFFEPQELFNPNKTSPHFVTELTRVSTNNNSYDRYTFSRLLEQIGTGSEPEVRGKININYVNDPAVNTVSTNFEEWTPYQFFTNVAERLIKDNIKEQVVSAGQTNFYLFNTNDIGNRVGENFSITNIQIYPTNEYTAPLHRLLQVAANIYDATTSNRYPTIYRPRFSTGATANYIVDFVAETNSVFLANALTNSVQDRTNITNPDGLVWGIPVVVAAKKGFPNFNEFMLQNTVQVSRNLQLVKPSLGADVNATNVMLSMQISNVFALEAWNSYIQPYTNRFRIIATNLLTISLTNESGAVIWGPSNYAGYFKVTSTTPWPGVLAGTNGSGAFTLPIYTNVMFMSNSTYFAQNTFVPGTNHFSKNAFYPNPTWGLVMTNRVVYALIDISQVLGRVVDFVNLDGMTANLDIMRSLLGENVSALPANAPNKDNVNLFKKVWNPDRIDGSTTITVPTKGMDQQILYSMGVPLLSDTDWGNYGTQEPPGNKGKAAAEFAKFRNFTPTIEGYQKIAMPTNLVVQTPFNPVRKFDQRISWQANDPLVHYMVSDLRDATNLTSVMPRVPASGGEMTPNNIGKINERYRPWGRSGGGGLESKGPRQSGSQTDQDYAYDLRVKDPRVRWSDDWDFPTNKFPSIGWLGRVHRGTPWQTIYFKAAAITNRIDNNNFNPPDDWQKWAGHVETHPTNDWNLLDVFTVAPNDNAARGLLSVNQTNQAAWSAVLSGVVALTNALSDTQAKSADAQFGQANVFQSVVIQPGVAISNIVNDINAVRTNRPNGVFNTLGEILTVPSLSDASPFLNMSQAQRFYGVTDEAYERIPQQIASLLKLGEPEFVVYCYGQSLKPAPNSIVVNAAANSGLFQLCTNYQITGEVVTRTVLRVEGTPQNPKTVIEHYNILPAE